ncbi:MAG: H-type lectin domain-containing protein [Roseivivax sp.]|nr:H-type lectin domain-containing protein [Roseivivax sp.]
MRRIATGSVGIAQGEEDIFSEFAEGGTMWTGQGERERRKPVRFDTAYKSRPAVHVGLALIDVDTNPNFRTDVRAENVTRHGFDLVFRTWSDSRVARIRMSWIAIGELPNSDDWDV